MQVNDRACTGKGLALNTETTTEPLTDVLAFTLAPGLTVPEVTEMSAGNRLKTAGS